MDTHGASIVFSVFIVNVMGYTCNENVVFKILMICRIYYLQKIDILFILLLCLILFHNSPFMMNESITETTRMGKNN